MHPQFSLSDSSFMLLDGFVNEHTSVYDQHILKRGDIMNPIPFCPNAIANISGGNLAPSLCGQVKFYQMKNYVFISVNVKGLPQNDSGFFGFHIHEGSSCTGSSLSDTGNHYNPVDVPHPTHAGDLPPLIRCNGGACQTIATDRFHLAEIIGRTVVIHNMPDDFHSQPAGNAGTKIACGVICRT